MKLNTWVAMNIRYYEENGENKCDQYVFGETHFVWTFLIFCLVFYFDLWCCIYNNTNLHKRKILSKYPELNFLDWSQNNIKINSLPYNIFTIGVKCYSFLYRKYLVKILFVICYWFRLLLWLNISLVLVKIC